MIPHPDIAALVATYGIVILAPLAVVEGPIVTVIAAYLVSQGILELWAVLVCVILADLLGDSLFYWLGRRALDGLSTA